MKDKIEIGDYVRSKFGEIKRVDKIFYNKKTSGIEEYGQIIEKRKESEGYTVVDAREVVKHSKNIIDLIEKGDFVNGHLVINKGKDGDLIIDDGGYYSLFLIDIKTILTHEMHERNYYKVEECSNVK